MKTSIQQNIRFILASLFCFLMQSLTAQIITAGNIDSYISTNFKNRYTQLSGWASNGNNATNLYNIETYTHNLLKYALKRNQIGKLDSLSNLFLTAYATSEYTEMFYARVCPDATGSTNINLGRKYRYWLLEGEENVLRSSQYLALVAEAINGFVKIPVADRTTKMNEVLEKYIPLIVKDHLMRWIDGPPNVKKGAWGGCFPKDCVNYMGLMQLRENNAISISPSYCGIILDTDLWIMSMVSDMLTANEKNPNLIALTTDEKRILTEFLDLATKVVKSRFVKHQVTGFKGEKVMANNFEEGGWKDYGDFRFAGYEGDDFPGCLPESKVATVGWDFSHARRFPHAFTNMYNNSSVIRGVTHKISFDDVRELANQYAYVVFTGNLKYPLFNNYFDGSNGWHRVNYSGQQGFAYPPYGMSNAAFGGFGFWQEFNPDIRILNKALLDMINSQDPAVINHHNSTWTILATTGSGSNCVAATRQTLLGANSKTNSNNMLLLLPSIADQLLEISLQHFEVSKAGKDALLEWSTFIEENTAVFEIEKSENASDWITVGNMAATGNTINATSYNYKDNQFTKSSFYRLKLIDKSGNIYYSDIKKLDINQVLRIYPNPAQLRVYLPGGVRYDRISVYSIIGQKVLEMTNASDAVNVADLVPGTYILQALQGAKLSSYKFIKE